MADYVYAAQIEVRSDGEAEREKITNHDEPAPPSTCLARPFHRLKGILCPIGYV